jgi:hypothetical protein
MKSDLPLAAVKCSAARLDHRQNASLDCRRERRPSGSDRSKLRIGKQQISQKCFAFCFAFLATPSFSRGFWGIFESLPIRFSNCTFRAPPPPNHVEVKVEPGRETHLRRVILPQCWSSMSKLPPKAPLILWSYRRIVRVDRYAVRTRRPIVRLVNLRLGSPKHAGLRDYILPGFGNGVRAKTVSAWKSSALDRECPPTRHKSCLNGPPLGG